MSSNKNKHNESLGSEVERSDQRISETGEVFTPPDLVNELIECMDESLFKNPNSKFLDNSAGNGNFIVELKNKLCKYHDEDHVINNMLYAVELMEDNHRELCNRLGIPITHPHYVCSDALEYHYRFDGTIGHPTLDQFFN